MNLEGYALLSEFNKLTNSSNTQGFYTSDRIKLLNTMKSRYSGSPAGFFDEDYVEYVRSLFSSSNKTLKNIYFPERKDLFNTVNDFKFIGGTPSMNNEFLTKEIYQILVER